MQENSEHFDMDFFVHGTSMSTQAVELTESCHNIVVEEGGYVILLSEQVNANYQTIRTFRHSKTMTGVDGDVLNDAGEGMEFEALLTALGWEKEFIDGLSPETRATYAEAQEIVTTVSYIKDDGQGNMSYLSEEAALREVALKEVAIQRAASMGITAASDVSESFEDSYMRVVHTAVHKGSGRYLFSTMATWLTMPTFRLKDAIGSCAPTLAIDNNTRSGWYSYRAVTNIFPTGEHTDGIIKNSITNVQNAINGDWYGSAGVFQLPNNYADQYSSATYTELRAYYEFEAELRYRDLATSFNSIGTYAHKRISVGIEPSVSISFDGKPSASISLGVSLTSPEDRRSAELLIHYDPT